jgi:hypothetical protein
MGEPIAPTPDITISNNQIATTLFVNVKLFVKQFEHITASTYTIKEGVNLIIENKDCVITLPTEIEGGTTITIVNSTDQTIVVDNVINKMHNITYSPYKLSESTKIYIEPRSTAIFTFITNNSTNINWWSVSKY